MEKCKNQFQLVCRNCYHNLKRQIGITNKDLRKCLKIGFEDCLFMSDKFKFQQVCELMLEKQPTIFKLANLIENI